MLDTTDLTSYIPGYDEYLKDIENEEEYDYFDEYRDKKLGEELENMKREIIDQKDITLEETKNLTDYVCINGTLVPVEMLEGE